MTESLLLDPHGTPYAKLYVSNLCTYESITLLPHLLQYQSSIFNLGAKVTGTKFSKFIAGPPSSKPIQQGRKPDHVYRDQTSPEQAIIYRLSGDYNPLHVGQSLPSLHVCSSVPTTLCADPAPGAASGFGGVILHGLSTFGYAARALITTVANGDAKAIKLFSVKFTAPVKPGDELETQAWEVGPGPNGTTQLAFVTKNLATGKV